VGAAGVPSAVGAVSSKEAVVADAKGFVDVNVSLGRWPFRRLPLDETAALVTHLKGLGVRQAWAGTFEGVLHKDVGSANVRLAEDCRTHGHGLLLPFGVVNPMFAEWEEELRRCAEVHEMRGIRLYPNYHGYKLSEEIFERLVKMAAERQLVIQIAVSMEDERMQHRLARVADVDVTALLAVLERAPEAKVMLLNWFPGVKGDVLAKLGDKVWFDIAMVEGVAGVEVLLKNVPAKRVVFGSHAPFYYFEAAMLKMKESVLRRQEYLRIAHQNARDLVRG
jgi:predicted TIM-barrel fold metal-dependent hydrolase